MPPMRPPSAASTRCGETAPHGPPRQYAIRPIWAGSRPTERSGSMRGISGMSRPAEIKPRRTPSIRGRCSDADVAAVVAGAHEDPFRVLGLHEVDRRWIARTFIAGAGRVSATLLDGTGIGDLAQRDPVGFFEGEVKLPRRQPIRY